MSELYPQSMLCRFEGFPARLRVTCGRAFSERRGTPYSFGSRVVLRQTPRSGVMDGELTVGQALPTFETIYSDTGRDDAFDLKLSHYGFGRFYRPTTESAYYALAVVKGLRVEATGVRRAFETVDVWETRIAVGSDLAATLSAGEVVVQDTDAATGTSVLWFVGTVPAGGTILSGTVQLTGDMYLQV